MAVTGSAKREWTRSRRHPHSTYAVITVVCPRQIRYNTAMSEKQKYNTVEKYRLDTWSFIAFMAVCMAVAHL